MNKHTEGKLTFNPEEGNQNNLIFIKKSGEYVCVTCAGEHSTEYAHHILACWNGCEGGNPAAVPMMVEALKSARVKISTNINDKTLSKTYTLSLIDAALDKWKEGE